MMLRPGGGSGGGGGPAPVFTLPLQNLTVQVGRNATFTCYVRHIQRYQVSLLPYARWGGDSPEGRGARAQADRARRGNWEGGRKQAAARARGLLCCLPCVREIVPHPSFWCIAQATSFPHACKRGCCSGKARDPTLLDWGSAPLLFAPLFIAFH